MEEEAYLLELQQEQDHEALAMALQNEENEEQVRASSTFPLLVVLPRSILLFLSLLSLPPPSISV